MPRRKQSKSKESSIAEEFFPVDETDIKYAVEKKYSKPSRESLEKIEKQGKIKKQAKKKAPRKSAKKASKKSAKNNKEFIIPKIKLKPKGYELIITEKPQAALKIASALGKATKRVEKNVPYYEVSRPGKPEDIVVACAVGHLFTLSQDSPGSNIPRFDISWKPNSYVRKQDFSKRYYDALVKLVKQAGSITVATDYDVEGELIGLNVVRFIAGQPDAKRMKFSTLTDNELNEAYEKKANSVNWGQAIAGETRHFLDWYYGINLSRALMNAIKTTGSFRIMSIGRVQGPTLKLIVDKEKQIQAFKPRPYWHVYINVESLEGKSKGQSQELLHNKDIFDKKALNNFESLKGKEAEASTKVSQSKIRPNPPFNLTTLQTEAYRLFKLTPAKTLQLAQSLYLNGLISYPRTSSQKLPLAIGYKSILSKLAKQYKVEKLITRQTPIEGKKTDPAHPSIYPTGELDAIKGLSDDEKKVYELIVKRFLALFMADAIKENKTISVAVESEKGALNFFKRGSYFSEKNWVSIYPTTVKEKKFPSLEGKVKINDVKTEEKETQPPNRFSPATIISELEKRNLGTKATRSSILETLYQRDYIKDTSIKATPLGIALIESLQAHSPIIIDESLTRNLEHETDLLLQAKKDFKSKEEKILEKARENITQIAEQFEKEQEAVGSEILQAQNQFREQQKEENTLNPCPVCGSGNLQIKYSKKTRRYFVACNAYPKCTNTYTLPPHGLMKPAVKGSGDEKTNVACEKCNWPMIMAIRKGKRPWFFCFNPSCVVNKERLEEYRKKQAAENFKS